MKRLKHMNILYGLVALIVTGCVSGDTYYKNSFGSPIPKSVNILNSQQQLPLDCCHWLHFEIDSIDLENILLQDFYPRLILFLGLFIIWGFSVTADSPQFSALVAKAVDEKIKGTALTIVTSIGFAITIVSIQLLKELFASYSVYSLLLLSLGPLFGLIALRNGRSE